jgi:hypothetical protein
MHVCEKLRESQYVEALTTSVVAYRNATPKSAIFSGID